MPNSVFGNIFAIPQINTRGIAAGVPKYNPMSGLAALIQAQNAVMRQARAAAGSAPLQPGQYKGVGDPSKGKWVKLPGVQDPVWIVGTSEKERAANEAKALNEARARIIQSDTELQNQLNGLSEKSVPAQQEVLAAVRSNGTVARMAQKLEMPEADTAKLLLDTPTQELAKRQKAINDAGFFRQLGDAKEAILDKFSATVKALGASAEERAALGQELQTKAEQRLQNNARADEFRRLEQEGRSTADYWIHNPLDTATMYAAPIAATVLPQIAGGVVGTMVGGPAGGLAGAVLGGGLSSAAYGGGEMLQRAATDPKLTTPEQRAQAADSAFAPGALISGAIGAIPFGPSSVATTFGRRAAANAIRGLPGYAAATTKERAAMAAQEYARRRAEHGFARRIGSSYLAAASDAAALGIAEQAGHNLAYGAATEQDIPVTEGWAEQGLASAVLGLPFAAVMGRRARYLYPGGRYPTPEPGPVVSAEVLPQYGLPPAAPMLGGAPLPTGPQGGGSAGGAARATGRPQGARASSTPGSEQANATADATIAQMNEAIRRNPANMAALEQLDAEVSKQVSDVAATVQKAKSASTLEKQLTRQLEQQGVDPAVLERLALSYPDTSWRKQALIKVLDKHQAALPPAEVVSLPPSVQDILGREAAELEAYRGNPPANATGRISESPADMATDEQLREGEVDTTNLAANRTEPVYPEAAAPAAADQPLAEARVSDTATEGRGDVGAETPNTGAPEAVAAAPRGQESGGTSQPDGKRSGVATAAQRAATDTRERGVESEAGAGPRSGSDGTDAGWAPFVNADGTVKLKALDAAIRKSDTYKDALELMKYEKLSNGIDAVRKYLDPALVKKDIADGGGVVRNRANALAARKLLKEKTANPELERYFAEDARRESDAFWAPKHAAFRAAIETGNRLADGKSWEQHRREGHSYQDWLDTQVKPDASITSGGTVFVKKNGTWYADPQYRGIFEEVPSVPDWTTRDGGFFPWHQSQEGVEAMHQHLSALRQNEGLSPDTEIADVMETAATRPTSEADIKAALETNPESFSAFRKAYPKADYQEALYNATKLMAKAALGKPLTPKEMGKLKALKALGLHDMDVNALSVQNTVEQAKEQGFLISPEEAVTKNPTESAAKIINNPNCTL